MFWTVFLVDLFLESHGEAPGEIVPDPDATGDPIHGHQEGRHVHGDGDHHGFLPLLVVCDGHIPCCRLRSAEGGADPPRVALDPDRGTGRRRRRHERDHGLV